MNHRAGARSLFALPLWKMLAKSVAVPVGWIQSIHVWLVELHGCSALLLATIVFATRAIGPLSILTMPAWQQEAVLLPGVVEALAMSIWPPGQATLLQAAWQQEAALVPGVVEALAISIWPPGQATPLHAAWQQSAAVPTKLPAPATNKEPLGHTKALHSAAWVVDDVDVVVVVWVTDDVDVVVVVWVTDDVDVVVVVWVTDDVDVVVVVCVTNEAPSICVQFSSPA